MKRGLLLVVISALLIAQSSWAGREKIATISKDPYISALVIDAKTGNPDR